MGTGPATLLFPRVLCYPLHMHVHMHHSPTLPLGPVAELRILWVSAGQSWG